MAACAHRDADAQPPEPLVVVRTVKDTPPAELLRCPVAPTGLPAEGEAAIPPAWRAAIIRLAKNRAEVADLLARLVEWHTGRGCDGVA
ncbi:hypothetical protein [Brevundimonas sp. RM1]